MTGFSIHYYYSYFTYYILQIFPIFIHKFINLSNTKATNSFHDCSGKKDQCIENKRNANIFKKNEVECFPYLTSNK